jgi:hypothetical protein
MVGLAVSKGHHLKLHPALEVVKIDIIVLGQIGSPGGLVQQPVEMVREAVSAIWSHR